MDGRRTDGLTPVLDEKVLGWAIPLSQSRINSLRNGSQVVATTGHLIRMEQRDREKQGDRHGLLNHILSYFLSVPLSLH